MTALSKPEGIIPQRVMKLNTEMNGFQKDLSTLSLKNSNRLGSEQGHLISSQDNGKNIIVDSRRLIAQQNLVPVLQERGSNPLIQFGDIASNSFTKPTRSHKKGFVIKKVPKRGSGTKSK